MNRKGDAVQLLELDLRAAGIAYEREYRFAPPRRWRFDFAIPDHKIAIEVDGATWAGGRHTTGRGHQSDAEKRNAAVLRDWRVLTYNTQMIQNGDALPQIEELMR